ncbi:MAG: aspartate kinase [SAR86 cluster bacterium]|jgi:aspartate kinase|uniref:Aspartokinase n=1 Tax=SAR86 cluster bacterium TaxID=2030880 RepID=A0A972W0F3_9GAMM|nr:aspartate kinase [SAR86 cluster bacterium]|tara:strand:- start:3521 stop:4738 length:1218 start_codon:yes stop_codon:yes gene_type:complete
MALIVQKYGGTSVATVAHLDNVARKIIATREKGHDVVVVVSAMGHETDRLDDLARQVGVTPETLREVDVLLSTGEQVTTALLSMVLVNQGCRARSYTGGQVKILTDSSHTKARILDIECERLQAGLDSGVVAIVAGFQGVDEQGRITTLGRGGSDTTAVALAAALGADECQIYTDVDGVYTTDPRVVDSARCLERLTFEEMLELASLGSGVLHTRAVEFASKYKVPIRVLSSFNDSKGTLITSEDDSGMEQPIISGIAFTRDEAKLTVMGVKDIPGIASKILGPISDANIEVDMIVQNVAADMSTDFTFTVSRNDYDQALLVLKNVATQIDAREISGDNKIAKVSLVGVGMRSHAGVATKMFRTLASESINIQMISTSEIKISVVIDEKYLELAVRALHAAFELE